MAEALARQKKLADTDDVFTPTLLHDMGKLILGQFVKEEWQSIQRITAQGVPLDIAEHMVIGTDHAEIGALILARWSFPDGIVNAVRWHHNPEQINNSTTKLDMVYLSNLVCQLPVDSDLAKGELIMPSSIVLDRLGIKLEQYEVFAEKTRNWIKKLSGTLTFD